MVSRCRMGPLLIIYVPSSGSDVSRCAEYSVQRGSEQNGSSLIFGVRPSRQPALVSMIQHSFRQPVCLARGGNRSRLCVE